MVIRYRDGSYVEGVFQKLEGTTVCAAVAGIDRLAEYTLIHDQWTSKTGFVVTFEFPVKDRVDHSRILPALRALGEGECAAGGDCALRRMSGGGEELVN